MHASQAFIELWEYVIDYIGVKSNTDPITYYPAIRTCCLVCALWLPRSRYNLYRTVSIPEGLSRSGLSRAYCLARTVCERSDLARLINELHLRPTVVGRTVPLAVAPGSRYWAGAMVSLRSVKLVGVMVPRYPGLYTSALSRFPALAHLELRNVAFDSASSLFYLVWSLPRLVSLDLHQVTICKLSQAKADQLSAASSTAAQGCLTKLSISGSLADEEHFPPPGAFGKALKKLSLEFSSAHWHRTRLHELLLSSTALEEFHACIRLGNGDTTPDSVCSELVSLFATRTLRLVELDLCPSSFMRGGYGVSRRGMIDALLGLGSPSLLNMNIRLSLFDDAVQHDSVWWSDALSDSGWRSQRRGDRADDVRQWRRPTALPLAFSGHNHDYERQMLMPVPVGPWSLWMDDTAHVRADYKRRPSRNALEELKQEFASQHKAELSKKISLQWDAVAPEERQYREDLAEPVEKDHESTRTPPPVQLPTVWIPPRPTSPVLIPTRPTFPFEYPTMAEVLPPTESALPTIDISVDQFDDHLFEPWRRSRTQGWVQLHTDMFCGSLLSMEPETWTGLMEWDNFFSLSSIPPVELGTAQSEALLTPEQDATSTGYGHADEAQHGAEHIAEHEMMPREEHDCDETATPGVP